MTYTWLPTRENPYPEYEETRNSLVSKLMRLFGVGTRCRSPHRMFRLLCQSNLRDDSCHCVVDEDYL